MKHPRGMKLPFAIFSFALLLCASLATAGVDVWTEVQVSTGVKWRNKVYTSLYGGKQSVNVLEIDLASAYVKVQPIRSTSGCKTTSSLGAGMGAVAAINGGFFDGTCTSFSMVKINNTVHTTNPGYKPARSTFGVNQGTRTPTIARIASTDAWSTVNDAIGGGPNLVTAGAVDNTRVAEGFDSSYESRNPRTAVGYAGSKLLLVTVDGRTSAGVGMTLTELASYMIALGCNKAMNLDGGGSTTMWTQANGVVNTPSDGSQRSVTSALGVFAIAPPEYVVDNTSTGFAASANWWTSTSSPGYLGTNYRVRSTQAVADGATWDVALPASGSYQVFVRHTADANRSATAPFVVYHSAGSATVSVNQQINNGSWVLLGTWNMNAGTTTRVALSCWTTPGFHVVADAVKLVKQ